MSDGARERPFAGASQARRVIPIASGESIRAGATADGLDERTDACASGEPFALMVLGDSMLPEFAQGEIILVEPEGLATDGSFVLAWSNDEWTFRQLVRGPRGWKLCALNPNFREIELADLSAVRGVIIQKSTPGRRRQSKRYVE